MIYYLYIILFLFLFLISSPSLGSFYIEFDVTDVSPPFGVGFVEKSELIHYGLWDYAPTG